jgi:quinate dehydrogenase (quinone)
LHTGDIPQSNGSGAEDQNTPLQIGDTLYVCTPYSKVLALDVDSGKEKWRYDSKATAPNWQRCRGLGYFEDHQRDNVTGRNTACGMPSPSVPADHRCPSDCHQRG